MSVIEVNPRDIVVERPEAVDFSDRERIQEHGLIKDQPEDTIRVRREDQKYKATSGSASVRAILSLIAESAPCYDPKGGEMGKAREIYKTIRVELIG